MSKLTKGKKKCPNVRKTVIKMDVHLLFFYVMYIVYSHPIFMLLLWQDFCSKNLCEISQSLWQLAPSWWKYWKLREGEESDSAGGAFIFCLARTRRSKRQKTALACHTNLEVDATRSDRLKKKKKKILQGSHRLLVTLKNMQCHQQIFHFA